MSCFADGIKDISTFFSGFSASKNIEEAVNPILDSTIDTMQASSLESLTHIVREGEKLSSIASKYKDITYQEIAQANGIGDPNNIYVGQRITIPNQPSSSPTHPKTDPSFKPVDDRTSIGNTKNQCKCPSAQWMKIAKKEIGTKEIHGKRHNPRVLEYHSVSGGFSTDEVPWCGSFVNWVMKQSGYKTVSYPARAKSWKNFGKKAKKLVYGAIGIKSRKGGGHVAFVVGQSKDGKYLYMLGGNQHDSVNISKYPKHLWTDFRLPKDYDETNCKLPIYNGSAKKGGKES